MAVSCKGQAPLGWSAGVTLAITRYSFYFEAFAHTSITLFANTSFDWAPHPPPLSPTLLRNTLSAPDRLDCNIYHTVLLMAISCKGKAPLALRPALLERRCSKGLALTWYRALTSSPARPFAAPDVPLLVTGEQGSPAPACRQLSRA